MTAVNSLSGTQLLIQLGDGNSNETFAQDCMVNTDRGIEFNSETNRQVIPDCDSPAQPAWSQIVKDGLSATITGAGILHLTTVDTWHNWFIGDTTKNIRVDLNAASGGGYWSGTAKLTSWRITGTRNEKCTVEVTIESYGAFTFTSG